MSSTDAQTRIKTEWVEITAEDGKTFKAYQALPQKGKGPGIVLIQEIFGVNGHIRGVAEQYALDGYAVIAPDMFWREAPGVELDYDGEDWKAAKAHKDALDFPTAISDLRAAVKYLRASPVCDGPVASVGYCMGGVLSYLSGVDAGVDAAICYYAGGVTQFLDRAGELAVPTQFHFGAEDDHIPLEHVELTRKAFIGNPEVEVHLYEGAEHGFNCWARSSYHQQASALAHGRTLTFLASRAG
ncbi:dienelactone hydrolase family protein [Salinicola rhizosphaerae]|uniref:Carboxymethylenebutenolidase n=1 Tax=Salinicola rhizosphaerae TaxID=1443141 RepID=A0ABQ3DV79_9GAMM|nr:dienelactone hydrolase family protein [Salinicola rhizosphaerae]GHB17468.1 carboxymethylenebutenolidase [Salinicola rhizosphaerae]